MIIGDLLVYMNRLDQLEKVKMAEENHPPPYPSDGRAPSVHSDLPAYTEVGPRPPQVFPRQQRGQHPGAAVEAQLRASGVYQRAAEQSSSSEPRRPSVIDTKDPNFSLPQEGDDPQTAMLREFARSKLYANDYWGGHKGAVTGEASEPPKIFGWMKRKLSGAHRHEGTAEAAHGDATAAADVRARGYAIDGEVARGDIDTSRLA